ETELVAMPHREEFWPVSLFPDKRIVRRHRSVVAQTQHLAVDGVGVLRLIAERRSSGDVDEPVGAKREPGSARAVVPLANEEILDVREGLAVELAARQHDRALTLLRVGGTDVSGLVVSEVDQPVGRKLRVQRDLMETAGPEGRHLRK